MNPLSAVSDQDLISLLKEGNDAAYTEIYHRYKGVLHLHAYKKLGDFEEAKDAVQVLFANLWADRDSMPATNNLSGYLYTSLRNRILNIISHKKVASKYIDSITVSFKEDYAITDYLVREKELASKIEEEIAKLPPKMQQIFIMSRKFHLSHKEIAQELSISPETVKNQIKNSIKILRKRLELINLFVFFL